MILKIYILNYIDRNLNHREPYIVYQWFIITEEGYNKFKILGYPVIKYKELYFYGRTSTGQLIITDFYDLPYYKLNDFCNYLRMCCFTTKTF